MRCLLAFALLALLPAILHARPNVVLVITDDQGHGDLGCHGNPKIQTPHLDTFAKESVRVERFHVCPVCSPTRSSLLTGRYNYRTGVVDTFLGRSLMHPDEITLAELLGGAGYKTGIFGKWHLGDNFPLRPQDQGFHECLVCTGGGLTQPSDPPGNTYFDPWLLHNGKAVKSKGYCSDVFTDAALAFIEKNRARPFFTYLAFNAPHSPHQVKEEDEAPYRKMNLAAAEFPTLGNPLPAKLDEEMLAKSYGMISNIDANVGRLLAKLDEWKLRDDTIVIFLTDNGPDFARYNSGFRDRKGSVYDGGIRVPFYVRWPAGQLKPGHTVAESAAHIDVTPTLLDACGVAKPEKLAFDGVSLLPLLRGDKIDWKPRTLFFQWHRGDVPQLYRAFAARGPRFKLVQPLGVQENVTLKNPAFKLFDMQDDPFERTDIAEKHPDIVADLKKQYEAWFVDVKSTRNFAPPRIALGAAEENPTTLTRRDWRGPRAGWGENSLGYWEIEVHRAGRFDITLRFPATKSDGEAHFALGDAKQKQEIKAGATSCVLMDVALARGAGRLEAWLAFESRTVGVHYVDVRKRDD